MIIPSNNYFDELTLLFDSKKWTKELTRFYRKCILKMIFFLFT